MTLSHAQRFLAGTALVMLVLPGPAAAGDLVTVRVESATSHTLTGRSLLA